MARELLGSGAVLGHFFFWVLARGKFWLFCVVFERVVLVGGGRFVFCYSSVCMVSRGPPAFGNIPVVDPIASVEAGYGAVNVGAVFAFSQDRFVVRL